MDFVKGNEIVKIDPNAIDICGNNHITLGTELITLDNEKSNGGVTKVAPEYIKLGGGEGTVNIPSTLENGLMRMNSQTHKIETYLNGAWTNLLTGTSSTAAITDLRFKFQDAHNTIANGIYHKDDDLDIATSYGYRNSNGVQLKRDYVPQDNMWVPGIGDWSAYEYYFATANDTYVNHGVAAEAMGGKLTSWSSGTEWRWIIENMHASGVLVGTYYFCGLKLKAYAQGLAYGITKATVAANGHLSTPSDWEFTDGVQVHSVSTTHINGAQWMTHPADATGHPTGGGPYFLDDFVITDHKNGDSEFIGIHSGFPWTELSAIYKRPRTYRNRWKIEYPISGTTHLLYDISYINPTNNLAFNADAAFSNSDISGYNYIDNNKEITNDPISFSNYNETIDRVNISINHNVPSSNIAGLYTVSDGLDATHHLLWSGPNNMSLSWKQLPDNTQLTTNKWGWCILSDSVIKYYSYLPSQTSINNGQSNPWDTNLIWTAANGSDSTMPIVNSVNANTSFEKTIIDHVVVVTGSSYEKANGTYRRNLTNNINDRHVYYNEHGLKLYYGALEYDGETPNNNTVTVTSYTINTWVSGSQPDRANGDYSNSFILNSESLIGYEYKLTQDTYTTWNDAETAAKNVYAHLVSFQTGGEVEFNKNIIADSTYNDSIWYGLYYDDNEGPETTTSTTDSKWKFIDRTQTFYERSSSTMGGVTKHTDYTSVPPSNTSVYYDSQIYNHLNQANKKAIFKRPQMWVQGTGSLTEYEYLLVNVSGISWAHHESKAQELGGHLISIHSSEELQFIKTKFGGVDSTATDDNIFIGLRTSQPDNEWNATTNNDWYYTDGTPFDYQFWGSSYPQTDTTLLRYGTSGVYGWTTSFTESDVEMFNNRSTENCIAIYKRKRNSWRIVDGKDTIYRFGEPTVTNTGSYVDSVTALVMQPKYRNDHAVESSRVVDAQDKALTVVNLTITGHVNTDYNGVYNYSNFKTDSTRKWVKSDIPNITLEYKETDNPLEQQSQYRWGIYNNNVLAMIGNIHINPWGDSGITVTWGDALPTLTRWGNGGGSQYQIRNITSSGQIFNYNPDDVSDGYATTGQRGPGYLWNIGWSAGWGLFAFAPETYHFNQTPGVVIYHGLTQIQKNGMVISIYPANKSSAELTHTGIVPADPTNVFSIHWSYDTTNSSSRWKYFKENVEQVSGGIADTDISNFQSIEITYEPDTDGVYQYYMNFFARSAGTDPYAVNYPYDVKTRVPGTDRYLLAGGSDNAFITHGFQLGYQPYRGDNTGWFASTPGSNIGAEPLIYTRWIYHDKLYGECVVQKVVTATTNTETNLQITGQLSGTGPTTSVNIEHGITMTEGSTTVSVDKTNGVNIQNTDLAITDGNIGVNNGNIIVSGTGNVGIGTTNPEAQLHIKNDTINNTIQDQLILQGRADTGPGSGQSILFKNSWSNANGHYGEWKLGSISGFHDGSEWGGGLAFSTTLSSSSLTTETTEHMRITHDGYVGIGTDEPSCVLHVTGTGAVTGMATNLHQWGINLDIYSPGPQTTLDNILAWINGRLRIGTNIVIDSDSRIKTDISLIDDDKALQQVNALESKEYHYIDPIRKQEIKTIGFIAQEVKEVIPNAVSLQTDYVPDEMCAIIDPQWTEDAGKYYLNIPNLDMSGNFTGKAKFYVSNDLSGNNEVCKEIQVEDDNQTFIFDQSWNNVFLYGKEVTDFHTIDKNQIFALHHSAIQELDRKHKREVESKEEKIASLESRVESLEAFLLTVLSKQEQIIAKNTELENKILDLESNSNTTTQNDNETINNITLL